MTDQEKIAELERKLEAAQERLERLDPRPKHDEPIPVDTYLRRALERMGGDADAAAGLFMAWTEQNSEVRDSLRPLVREAIERRLALAAEAE